MAFEINSEKTKNIKKALEKETFNNRNENNTHNLLDIKAQPPHETKQRYNIMLDPSIKEKADKIAKEKNFKSTSSFINELIKSL